MILVQQLKIATIITYKSFINNIKTIKYKTFLIKTQLKTLV